MRTLTEKSLGVTNCDPEHENSHLKGSILSLRARVASVVPPPRVYKARVLEVSSFEHIPGL